MRLGLRALRASRERLGVQAEARAPLVSVAGPAAAALRSTARTAERTELGQEQEAAASIAADPFGTLASTTGAAQALSPRFSPDELSDFHRADDWREREARERELLERRRGADILETHREILEKRGALDILEGQVESRVSLDTLMARERGSSTVEPRSLTVGGRHAEELRVLALGGHTSVADLLFERDSLAAALAAEQRRASEFEQLWRRAEKELQLMRDTATTSVAAVLRDADTKSAAAAAEREAAAHQDLEARLQREWEEAEAKLQLQRERDEAERERKRLQAEQVAAAAEAERSRHEMLERQRLESGRRLAELQQGILEEQERQREYEAQAQRSEEDLRNLCDIAAATTVAAEKEAAASQEDCAPAAALSSPAPEYASNLQEASSTPLLPWLSEPVLLPSKPPDGEADHSTEDPCWRACQSTSHLDDMFHEFRLQVRDMVAGSAGPPFLGADAIGTELRVDDEVAAKLHAREMAALAPVEA